MRLRSLDKLASAICLAVGLAGCASFAPSMPSMSLPQFSDPQANTPGTRAWWKKHRKVATLELGEGYKVAGVPGYFDGEGRRIDAPVSEIATAYEDPLEKQESGLIPGFDPKNVYAQAKTAVGLGPNEQIAQVAFDDAEKLFAERRFKQAAKKYKEAADRWPNSTLEQEAMFKLADSYFFDDRYIQARDAYDALVSKYPNTRHLDLLVRREWEIARYWEAYEEKHPDWVLTPNAIDKTRPWFDTIGHAIKTYESIRLNDPTGPWADDAIMATANIYFRRGRYQDADIQYSQLRSEYPRSEHQFEAHILGLQSKLRKYQGPDYDGAPLEEAEKLVKQLRTQFAGQMSADDRERLRNVQAQLNLAQAERTMRMAKYYDDTKYYGPARDYYNELIAKHPSSPLAEQARTRLAEIQDEPAQPPKPLAWLVDQFPESRERSAVARIPELQGKTRVAENPEPPATSPEVVPASGTTVR
jgi:outer membrane protein assembly factor BamD (BamD/ComL family)